MSRFALLLVVLTLASPATLAQDVFVNNVIGHDRLDGSSPERSVSFAGPVKTIGRALQIAKRSGRIILAKTDQPYREGISLSAANHCGDIDHPFTIVGNGAVLDGTMPIPERVWEFYDDHVFRYRPYHLGQAMLFVDGEPLLRQPGAVPRRGKPTLEARQWDTAAEWVYFRVEKGKLPFMYAFSHAVKPVGITLYHVRNVVIEDLTVQGFRIDGVNVNDNVSRCALFRVTSRRNGRAGVFVGGASEGVVIDECQVAENAAAQLLLRGDSITTLRNNKIVESPTAPAVQREERAVLYTAQ